MKNQASRPNNPQSGTIFVWIFVMIALFGALSFAMMQSGRQGSSNLGAEKARLAATEILEYQSLVARTVKEMRINGIPLEQIDFSTDTLKRVDGTLATGQASTYCTTNACKVFHTDGGGLRAKQFYEYGYGGPTWTNPVNTHEGGVKPYVARVVELGTNSTEVILSVVKVKQEICDAYNKMSDLQTSEVAADSTGSSTPFGGDTRAALASNGTYVYGTAYPKVAGKRFFCNSQDRNASYVVEVR